MVGAATFAASITHAVMYPVAVSWTASSAAPTIDEQIAKSSPMNERATTMTAAWKHVAAYRLM